MAADRSDRERVVITGMGWVTPLGHDLESVWSRLMDADSGMAPVTRFDAATFPTSFAAEVRDYDVSKYVDDPAVHEHAGLNVQFALGAARQAWTQAGLEAGAFDPLRAGMYLGAGEGVLDFDNYAASNIAGWDGDQRRVDGVNHETWWLRRHAFASIAWACVAILRLRSDCDR